ncbi:MAG TPA: sigma-70 family RNA polymerase sigma factor [Nocardioidaceae bacterium]|nr:sigma-70 family RNA polymerase sigma factor [Nocardioidaceae bacterium]
MDSHDFADLFFAHAARLVRLAALLGDPDPEDVVQEAFCRVYGARRRLYEDGTGNVSGYLHTAVVNLVRDRYRRRTTARDKQHLVLVEASAPAVEPDSRTAVIAALSRLPQRKREALVLRYWLDLPLAEIATAMGVRTGTVKALISRGLDALALDLEVDR